MHNSKVINALKKLDAKEFKRLGLFVASPYYNTNPTLIKFYEAIKRFYPDFKSRHLDKKTIFKQLYPETEYKDGTLRNVISDFTKILLRYLTLINFEKDEQDKKIRLLRELTKRKSDSYYYNVIQEYEKMLKENSEIGYSFFNNVKQLEEIKINYELERGGQKSVTQNILKRSEFATYDFIIYMLNDFHNLTINKEAYNADSNRNLARNIINKLNLNGIIKYCETYTPEHFDILKLFLYEGLAFINPEQDEYYFKFKKIFFEMYNKLNPAAIENFFTSLENACIEKIFTGKADFIKEQMNIYTEQLNRNAYKDSTGEFNLYLFRNIIQSAITGSEIKWLEEFIKKYSHELPVDFREDMINFAEGLICFEKGLFREALYSIGKISDKAEIYKFTIYTLKLKIFYEINDLESAEYNIDSFTHFISQNKTVSERFRNNNKNFLKAYSSLIKIKSSASPASGADYLLDFINSFSYFKEKNWLIKKINNC